jgi:hypothetical protein
MKFIEASEKKSLDFTVEQLEKLVGEYQAKIEEVKGNLTVWEAEENDTDEEMEVDTTAGKMIVGPGDYVFTSGAKKMAVLKEIAHNEDLWVEVEK